MKARLLVVYTLFFVLVPMLSGLSSNADEPEPAQVEKMAAIQSLAQGTQVVGQLGGTVHAVAVQGSQAYVGAGPRLVVLDITDQAHPATSGQSAVLPDIVEHVTVSSTLAYIAAGYSGLYILNISNPAAPVEIGAYDTPGQAYDVVVSGSYAYVVYSASLAPPPQARLAFMIHHTQPMAWQ